MNRQDAPDADGHDAPNAHQSANCPGSELVHNDVAQSSDNGIGNISVREASAPTAEPRRSLTTAEPSMQMHNTATETQVEPLSPERVSMRDMALNTPAVPEFRQRNWFEEKLITVFGLFALASPLLLWISWTQVMFEIVLALSIVSIAVCYGVVHFSKGD